MGLPTAITPVHNESKDRSQTQAAPGAVLITHCDPWTKPYYREDGLRRVAPYNFTYKTYCKERWRGREILWVYETEFRDRPADYYKAAIESGEIAINGKAVSSVHQIVKNGDVITHTLHRHEPPVTSYPIVVIHEDEDMIVINKPAGVPVHPAGRYNYNSLVEIMRADRVAQKWNPLPCNRLDRLTSGIMFVGKHHKAADRMMLELKNRLVRKEYVARVKGEFPIGDVICEQPILQISPKLGLNRVRANGKTAKTVFKRLAYYPVARRELVDLSEGQNLPWKKSEGYSIVRCLPLTGRTHQIRVHLQFLGHPITNDPIYCNQRVFGPNLGIGSADSDDDETVIERLERMGKDEVADAVAYHDELVEEYDKRKAERMTGELCDVCKTPLYSDPGEHEMGIYLHAKRYAAADGSWSYETDLPAWALSPNGMTGPTIATAESDPMALDLEKLGMEDESPELETLSAV